MAQQCSSAPLETPGNVVLPNPSVHHYMTRWVLIFPFQTGNKLLMASILILDVYWRPSCEIRMTAIILVNCELCARERSSPKIATIEQWTDAFILFMNIYVGAHPNKIHQLLKYLHSTRLGASRFSGQGWILYDEQFSIKSSLFMG